ncbi:hypothetical protein [Scytonema sp. PRP1]|uniref:hypothetical protein n=1 Tax=Scytonema sp. PRP1 TaxID=3120513 RepID=UPI002FD038CE
MKSHPHLFISIFLLTLLISLFLNFQISTTNATQTTQTLAFIALQNPANTVKNSLFTIEANGSARHNLTPTLEYSVSPTLIWSPNGQRLAFVASETELYVVNSDGSRLAKVFSGGGYCKAANFGINWLDSQKIIFAISCDGPSADLPGSESLYISDTTGIPGTKLIKKWEAGGVPPKTEISSLLYLSPNGKQVIFIKDRNIYKMNTDGSGLVNLTNKPGDYIPGSSGLMWSPDSTQIAFFEGKYPTQNIYVMNADGTNLRNLTKTPETMAYSGRLFWSPDSNHIAYFHDQGGNNRSQEVDIYLLDVSRGTVRNLTKKPGWYGEPSWSPNGKQIAFLSGDLHNPKLYTINVDGSNRTELLSKQPLSQFSNIAWSADSQQIAFTSGEIGKTSLYVAKRHGSGLTKLTNNNLSALNPTWQP